MIALHTHHLFKNCFIWMLIWAGKKAPVSVCAGRISCLLSKLLCVETKAVLLLVIEAWSGPSCFVVCWCKAEHEIFSCVGACSESSSLLRSRWCHVLYFLIHLHCSGKGKLVSEAMSCVSRHHPVYVEHARRQQPKQGSVYTRDPLRRHMNIG